MNCFDTTFVIDYLSGEEATVEYLEEHSDEEFHVPAVVLHEGIDGVVKSAGDADIQEFVARLGWAKVAPFGRRTAIEAGRVQKKLAENGAQLKPVDAMVAGTASQLGATLVTRDSDMTTDAVRGILDVREY
jgi:predicted nucleic acid-binding protein